MSHKKTDLSQDQYNRRVFLHTAAIIAGGSLLAACGGDSTAAPLKKLTALPTMPGDQATATVQAAVGKTYFPSGDPKVPDAYTAPLPTYQSVFNQPGSGKPVNVFTLTYNTLPLTRDKNKYWQELEKRLNVKWNVTFATSPDVYREKVSTLLASGNLADLFFLDASLAPALGQALQQGAFTDLTERLTGENLKKYPNLARISSAIWKNARLNDKLYGVPRPRILTGNILAYRQDWAKKLGLDNPQNGEDFLKLMEGFSKKKPGGRESWAMGISPRGISAHAFFLQIFNVPNGWRKESNGKLTNFIETEEYKQSIEYMRRAFAAGYFYPDISAQAGLKLQQNFIGGKTGMYVAGLNGLPILRNLFRSANVKEADTRIIVPFGANGGKGSHHVGLGFFGVTGIPSSVTDNGRIEELLRILDYLAAPIFSDEANFLQFGIDEWDSTTKDGIRKLTKTGSTEILDLVNVTNGAYTYYYPSDIQLGRDMQEYTRQLLANGIENPAATAYSTTSTKQSGVLGQLMDDRILRILRGTDPLSAIDEMVKEWRKQGGDQIRQEYEQQVK